MFSTFKSDKFQIYSFHVASVMILNTKSSSVQSIAYRFQASIDSRERERERGEIKIKLDWNEFWDEPARKVHRWMFTQSTACVPLFAQITSLHNSRQINIHLCNNALSSLSIDWSVNTRVESSLSSWLHRLVIAQSLSMQIENCIGKKRWRLCRCNLPSFSA